MAKFIDLTGQTFGRWTVLVRVPSYRPVKFICKCSCGKIKAVHADTLRYGTSTSCGCITIERQVIPEFGSQKKYAYNQSKREAAERNLCWELTFDEYIERCNQNCVYCGDPPKIWMSTKRKNWPHNGVDRLNNNLGYTPWNSVPCCRICNVMKTNLTIPFFIEHISKIYKFAVEEMGSRYRNNGSPDLKGTISADNAAEAAAKLRELGIYATKIEPIEESKNEVAI